MPSSPPEPLASRAVVRLAMGPFRAHARDEGVIFFCVENAAPQCCWTRSAADGSLTFETLVEGRVETLCQDQMHVRTSAGRLVAVRFLLPSGIEADSLIGEFISLRVTQTYARGSRATIDATFRDSAGQLIAWAHDGRPPEDRDAHGLSFRTALGEDGPRLAVRADEGVVPVRCADVAQLRASGSDYVFALLRVDIEGVAFVLLRL